MYQSAQLASPALCLNTVPLEQSFIVQHYGHCPLVWEGPLGGKAGAPKVWFFIFQLSEGFCPSRDCWASSRAPPPPPG